jgi:uncharacterized phiE125 gp8 family phage protein
MTLSLASPPAEEPVSLAEAQAHLKLDTDDNDALIAALVSAARTRAEWHTGRAFVAQGWTLWLDGWPEDGIVEIPLPPLISVASVTTYARNDTATVLAADSYRIDAAAAPARLAIKNALAPPVATLRRTDGIAVAFTAGYGAASAVPAPIKQAILAVVADLYVHRGDEAALVGDTAAALLAPYRVFKL